MLLCVWSGAQEFVQYEVHNCVEACGASERLDPCLTDCSWNILYSTVPVLEIKYQPCPILVGLATCESNLLTKSPSLFRLLLKTQMVDTVSKQKTDKSDSALSSAARIRLPFSFEGVLCTAWRLTGFGAVIITKTLPLHYSHAISAQDHEAHSDGDGDQQSLPPWLNDRGLGQSLDLFKRPTGPNVAFWDRSLFIILCAYSDIPGTTRDYACLGMARPRCNIATWICRCHGRALRYRSTVVKDGG